MLNRKPSQTLLTRSNSALSLSYCQCLRDILVFHRDVSISSSFPAAVLSSTDQVMANLFARTTLGPLTTTYTPPASCNVAVEQCSTCINAWAAQTCFASTTGSSINYGVQDNPDCWPPRLDDSILTPVPPFQGWGFYTPGVICPVGYTSACSATAGGSSGWSVQYSMTAGETAVGCCPTYVDSLYCRFMTDFTVDIHVLQDTPRHVFLSHLRQVFLLFLANQELRGLSHTLRFHLQSMLPRFRRCPSTRPCFRSIGRLLIDLRVPQQLPHHPPLHRIQLRLLSQPPLQHRLRDYQRVGKQG